MTNMSIQPLWLTYFIEILLVLEFQLTKTYFGAFSYKAHFRPQISSNDKKKKLWKMRNWSYQEMHLTKVSRLVCLVSGYIKSSPLKYDLRDSALQLPAVFWCSCQTRVWLSGRYTPPKTSILGLEYALWKGTNFHARSFPKPQIFLETLSFCRGEREGFFSCESCPI